MLELYLFIGACWMIWLTFFRSELLFDIYDGFIDVYSAFGWLLILVFNAIMITTWPWGLIQLMQKEL